MAVPNLTRPARLEVEERQDASIVWLRVRGELDLSTAPGLCRAIHQATTTVASRRIAIDLRSVGFCDSTGLRALMGAVNEVDAQAGAVAIVISEGSSVDRTLALAGLREFLQVVRAVDDARRLLAMR
jgi:anti-sigma B factor antagonist